MRYSPPVTVLEDLEEFVRLHREHGQLVGDATEPTRSATS